jgi:hypothetical protein
MIQPRWVVAGFHTGPLLAGVLIGAFDRARLHGFAGRAGPRDGPPVPIPMEAVA